MGCFGEKLCPIRSIRAHQLQWPAQSGGAFRVLMTIVSFSRSAVLALACTALTACSMLTPASTPVPQAPEAAPAAAQKPFRIGLALGGGAARGFAHIGVIKALESQGI